jgi:hypothetical protein
VGLLKDEVDIEGKTKKGGESEDKEELRDQSRLTRIGVSSTADCQWQCVF